MRLVSHRLHRAVAAVVVISAGACNGSKDTVPVGGTAGTSSGASASGGLGGGGGLGGSAGNAGTGAVGGTAALGSGGTSGLPGTGGTSATGGLGASGGTLASGGAGASSGSAGSGDGGGGAGSSGMAGVGGDAAAAGRAGSAGDSSTGGASGSAGMAGVSGSGGSGGNGGSGGAVPSAGCGKALTITFGSVPGESGQTVGVGDGGYVTIQSSGQTRGFAMRLPDNYDQNKPYWLIFGFHWNGGTSKDVDTGGSNGYIMAHFGLQSLSNNGAIFVAPQGLGNGWPNSGGQDLKFVDDMIQLIEENYCVDTTHLFSNGFSYGGGMTYELACARANSFRGAAIYEGAQLSGCDGGNDPIALWQMVGLEDTTCPMSLATPIRDRFVKNNGCTVQNPPQPAQPPPYLSPGGHVCTDYAGCSSGHPLRWCVHQSGHGNAIVDGTSDLFNSCATPPKSCSLTCPCTWVPEDVSVVLHVLVAERIGRAEVPPRLGKLPPAAWSAKAAARVSGHRRWLATGQVRVFWGNSASRWWSPSERVRDLKLAVLAGHACVGCPHGQRRRERPLPAVSAGGGRARVRLEVLALCRRAAAASFSRRAGAESRRQGLCNVRGRRQSGSSRQG